MPKKPTLMDDELDGGIPAAGATPPPLPGARSAPAGGQGTPTRPVETPPPPPAADATRTRPLDLPEAAPAGASGAVPGAAPEMMEKSGHDASGHARPRTRIHGYGGPQRDEADRAALEAAPPVAPAVGWLVVVAGPGRGAASVLVAGMNAIGRGPENAVVLDHGDDTISRDAHAFVTYDNETRMFHLSHAGRTNIVRRNDAPVLAPEVLGHGDTIRIGATSLRFVAFCGPDFDWADA